MESAFPVLIHFAAKYSGDFERALLANANAGGANVDRGLLLGAILGAQAGEKAIPEHLKTGLKAYEGLRSEIEAFKAMVSRTESAM